MVGGMVRTQTGSYDMAFLSAAATATVALVLAFFLVPKSGQEHLKRPGAAPAPRTDVAA